MWSGNNNCSCMLILLLILLLFFSNGCGTCGNNSCGSVSGVTDNNCGCC